MSGRDPKDPVLAEPSRAFREALAKWTPARVALGRAGSSLPTRAHLRFLHDHAKARDAVWSEAGFDALASAVARLGAEVLRVRSEAADRAEYLARPDLGRRLRPADVEALGSFAASRVAAPGGVVVVADGLSARAVDANAAVLLSSLLPMLEGPTPTVVLAAQARVALGDAVAEALAAEYVLVLVGERPGLSASDSLGCYLTWAPRTGTPDSMRNCVSNIRAGGLAPAEAARRIAWLVAEAPRRPRSPEPQALTSTLVLPAAGA